MNLKNYTSELLLTGAALIPTSDLLDDLLEAGRQSGSSEDAENDEGEDDDDDDDDDDDEDSDMVAGEGGRTKRSCKFYLFFPH